MDYFISKNYCEQGPYSEEQLQDMKLRGELEGEWYACPVGDTRWLSLAEIHLSCRSDNSETPHATRDHSSRKASTPPLHPLTGFPTALAVLSFFIILFSAICFALPDLTDFILSSCREMMLGSFIILLTWCYRIAQNANIIANKNETISSAKPYTKPGFFVWSFFIPLFNLIAPCLTMQRIYQISHSPLNRKPKQFSWIVTFWWISSLILLYKTFSGELGSVASCSADGIENGILNGNDIMLSLIIQQALLCLLVWKLTRAQREKNKDLID